MNCKPFILKGLGFAEQDEQGSAPFRLANFHHASSYHASSYLNRSN